MSRGKSRLSKKMQGNEEKGLTLSKYLDTMDLNWQIKGEMNEGFRKGSEGS